MVTSKIVALRWRWSLERVISIMLKIEKFTARTLRTSAVAGLTLIVLAALAAGAFTLPFGKWTRLSEDPILSPKGDGFESAGTFNPSVVKKGGKFVMLYRAQDRQGTSSLGYATSDDGIHFKRRPEPVMSAEAPL